MLLTMRAILLKKEKITQKRLAKAAGITEVTVRNRTKGLLKRLDLNTRPGGAEKS